MSRLHAGTVPNPLVRRESMPSGDSIWGRRASILPSMSWKKPSEIEIVLDGEYEFIRSFSTFDAITGHVNLRFEKDTCIDDFAITLQGQANTWIERAATGTPLSGRTAGKHTFLRVQQPIDPSNLPEYNRAVAGETYSIPFNFVVPDKMLDFICKHDVEHNGVREHHLQLPPSIGDPMLSGNGNTLMDDLAPSMAKISYVIRVALLKASPSVRKAEILSHELGIRIIPAREEFPPVSVDLMKDKRQGKYCLRKEKNVRKGVFNIGKKQGCLTAEAPQPASLKLHHPSHDSEEPATTMTTVQLRFDPASMDEQPPCLSGISNKLRSFTFWGAAAWRYMPAPEAYDIHSVLHSQYPDSLDLSCRNLSNVEWVKHESKPSSTAASTQRANPLPIPSAYERRSSKSLATSGASNGSAGTRGSRSTGNNPLSRRASTFSTASTDSSSSNSDDASSSSSQSTSTTDLSRSRSNPSISPSSSYNPSLPYYTTSILVPITLPTTPVPSSTSTTNSPSQSRRPSLGTASSPTTTNPSTSSSSLTKPPKLSTSRNRPIAFLPTFYSCLVSRVYSLDLAIHSHGAPTITLKLPLQLSLPYDRAKQEQHQSLQALPPSITDPSAPIWATQSPFSDPSAEGAYIDSETTASDEALARALASSNTHPSQYAYQSTLPNVPEYEATYHPPSTDSTPPPPMRHRSLPLLDLHHPQPQPQPQPQSQTSAQQSPSQPTDEAPPEYHSAIRRVSAARRAATALAQEQAQGSGDQRRLRENTEGGVRSQGRRRSILFGL